MQTETQPDNTKPGPAYLAPTFFLDSDSPTVRAFTAAATRGAATPSQQAVKLFYAVRDRIRYDPYRHLTRREAYKASAVLKAGAGYCVPKAILLCAAARAAGIPAALAFADVKNHLNTRKLRERMGTDLFIYHGYAELYLDGRWVRVTPTFNLSLCEKFNVKPLEFDGRNDAIFHPYDASGRRHMEYVRYHGRFEDFPYETVMQSYAKFYSGFWGARNLETARFEDETPLTGDEGTP